MKNFRKIVLITLVGLMCKPQESAAQFGSPYIFPVIAGDSLATADTVFKRISVTAGYNALAIQVDIKKGTGTLDGKFYLYTSVNGGRYVLTDSASFSAVPSFNTLSTNSGYTHTAIIQKAAPGGSKYVVAAVQTGSLTASPVLVSYTSRKYD